MNQSARKITYGLQASLLLLALAAPVSIAATQTAWALAWLCWAVRACLNRSVQGGWFTALEGAALAFVGWSLVSSVFSYEPLVSLRKMLSVMLVSIVYLVAENLDGPRLRRWLVTLLLVSGVVSVAYTVGVRAVGKNLKVQQMTTDSPLRAAGVQETDTILTANGRPINTPEELVAAILTTPDGGAAHLIVYRYELLIAADVAAASLKTNAMAAEQLGLAAWSRGRDTRAAGFYGHYTTYAEVLQMLAALALGLLVAAPGGWRARTRLLLAGTLGALGLALLWTVTRASWAAFLAAAGIIVMAGASRRAVLFLLACAAPLVLAGLFVLQQKRHVGFVDANDGSTTWRLTVWREGFGLLTQSPRHLLVGIGMDSLKNHWREWHLFDDGKLPVGHMHSTPLQLALERGVPALLAWLVWLALYWRTLWQTLRRHDLAWPERGVTLGALGGSVGFFLSGLVHYNWGDSEVVMVFYLLMGLAISQKFKSPKAKVCPSTLDFGF